jgi:insulysin
MKNGIVVDQAAIGALLASKPDLQPVKDFAIKAVEASEAEESVKSELKTMIEGLNGLEAEEKSGDEKVRESNVFIDDIDRFKAGLIPSRAAMPVEPLALLAKL